MAVLTSCGDPTDGSADGPPPGEPPPASLVGLAVMGASNSDEYRTDDDRGGSYGATTLNWVEQLVASRRLNFGAPGTWGEPRRSGYAYNWARSGATAASLVAMGQHTGVAEQVRRGQVSHAFLYVGSNDFHPTNGSYEEIYDGSLSGAGLQAKIDRVAGSMATALDEVRGAGPVGIMTVNVGDPGLDPSAFRAFPSAAGRARVTAAIRATNDRIQEMADSRRVPVIDLNGFAVRLLDRVNEQGFLIVGGEPIDVARRGSEPHHLRLDDSSGHPGTVMSGLMANGLFLDALNRHYGTGVPLLTDEEILRNAGIR